MRKTIFRCLGVAAVAFALLFTTAHTQAAFFDRFCSPCDEAACSPCDEVACDPCEAVCGPKVKAGKWFLEGHIEAGFFANAHGQKSRYHNDPAHPYEHALVPMSGNTELLGNARLTGGQVNQIYISMGREVEGRHGWDFGGKVDFSWGTDAHFVQTSGLEEYAGLKHRNREDWRSGDYYTAIVQAYAEAEYGRWNFKLGKFEVPMGSNPYASTERFFYTLDQAALHLPHVASGAYATYEVSDDLVLIGGWGMPDRFFDRNDANFFIGGFDTKWSKDLSFRYVFAMGRDKQEVFSRRESDPERPGCDVFVNSLLMNYQINKRLKWVCDWSYTSAKISDMGGTAPINPAVYSVTNEFIYQYNKRWSFGLRSGTFAWNQSAIKADGLGLGFVGELDGHLTAGASEWYTTSIGANWTPYEWLIVKPEIRYDWMKHKDIRPFDAMRNQPTSSSEQFSGGMSAIVKF
jgi:hypothetical protein